MSDVMRRSRVSGREESAGAHVEVSTRALHEHRYTGLVTLDTTPAPPEDHVLVITRALGAFRTDPTG